MKKLIVLMLVACISFAFGEDKKTQLSDESSVRRAENMKKMLKKTGGIVERKGDGRVVFVNCQTKIAASEIRERVDRISYVLKYNCEIVEGAWKFGQGVPDGASVAIYIVDDENLPMSLVATEAHWGVLNTVNLKLGSRFSKELTRVFTLVTGGGMSQVKTAPMQPVSKASDLDNLITDGFTFDMANAIVATLKSIGVTQGVKTTYRKACMEGWADAPTNDYQKAIWEEVHAIPDKPIQIKFDPAVGK